MADLVQTPGNVLQGSEVSKNEGTAGATITAGMPVYMDSGDSNKLKPCDTTTAAKSACVGIALHGASNGQPLKYQNGGTINLGATLAVGTVYAVSDTGGSICPVEDNGAGDFGCVLGYAISTSLLKLGINASGVAHA